ncbi:MAG: SDR family oxidoreductase [Erysipelotrichaceae bacterium]|nr:SDR family oxidoreductase [Erysipelotrichaceae bacterium]
MKVLLAGAFGHLGSDVLKSLVNAGHEVIAADIVTRDLDFDGFTPLKIDMTDKEKVNGICEGVDAVVSTVGLTKASETVTPYDVDYGANKNLLDEALRAGVKNFAYVSVIKADKGRHIPMLDAKAMFEEELKKSGIQHTIYRPTGYFYDVAHIFQPKVEKGKVSLLKTKEPIRCNVIDTPDFADYIVEHMCDDNKSYDVGGTETYTFEEIAKMFFDAAGKEPKISYVPSFMFDLIELMNPKWKRGVIKFGKWTMTEDMVADVKAGKHSFSAFIKEIYEKGLKF